MPKLSDATRQERRDQILDGARACVDEHGLEAVSMEMIIARSGVSTGTVYRYFSGKDEVISAAVLDGTTRLGEALAPVLSQDDPPPPAEFIGQILRVIAAFGRRGQVDLTRVALHGWSHSRSHTELRVAIAARQRGVRDHYAQICRRWQASGVLDPDADPQALAELMLSITLGFIAQRSLAGNAEVDAHVAALTALIG